MEDKNHMASRPAAQAKPREVAISGELVKDATTPHVYLYVDNTGCGDGVLHEIPNVPLSECESICTADIACGVYTYRVPERSCAIRSTCTLPNPASFTDFTAIKVPAESVSGLAALSNAPAQPTFLSYTYIQLVGCKDPHFQVLRDVPQSACELACSSEVRCRAYTYNTDRNDCYLKETCTDVEAVDVDVSAFKDGESLLCANTAGTVHLSYTYMESVGCMDPHFEVLRDVQQTTCESACSAEERCSAYTYNTDTADSDPGASLEGGWQWSGQGSEIIGYFDRPIRISEVGDQAEISFLWQSEGEIQAGLCPARYGYYNTKMLDYRGVQWRFHPHACPQIPRDYPGGYAATAASSWIRSNLDPDFINARGLVCDFVETPELGDRSFKERMFDPAEVRFTWTMEFNGWSASKTETWDEDLFPDQIDSVVIGYTNPRSFTSLKLKRVT
eukprot:jgi/Tetstr1/425947/TSEL_016299.t1